MLCMHVLHMKMLLFFFAELKKFKHYQIVMTSYNIIGESPPSTPVEVSVGEAGKWKHREAVTLITSSMYGRDIFFILGG